MAHLKSIQSVYVFKVGSLRVLLPECCFPAVSSGGGLVQVKFVSCPSDFYLLIFERLFPSKSSVFSLFHRARFSLSSTSDL